MKKHISLVLAIMMVLLLFPNTTLAASGAISTSGTYDIGMYGNGAAITIDSGLDVTLTNTSSLTYTDMQIICGTGVKLTISGIKIVNENDNACALSFSGSDNQLILAGNSSLTSGYYAPGIKVETGTALEILGEGSLTVRGGTGGAGIGAGRGEACGAVTISGGTITAYGGASGADSEVPGGAGIGAGQESRGGSLSIQGGTVYAQSGDGAAYDIGDGVDGSMALSFSGDSALFLKNGTCISSSSATHTLKTVDVLTDGKAYGLTVPDTWSAPIYIYLNDNNLFDLAYDANGGIGTAPATVMQISGTTTTIAGGAGLTGFVGWNTESDGTGDDYPAGGEYTFTKDVTLFAQYEGAGESRNTANSDAGEKIAVSSVTLSSNRETITEGDTLQLTATVLPEDATYPDVVWTSSNETVATVDQTGTVTAVQGGFAIITATADGVSGSCKIIVQPSDCATYLRSCNIDFGIGVLEGVWGTSIGDVSFDDILDPVINLTMPNYFSQCELQPYCSSAESTYQILSGSQIVGNNAPYTVTIPAPGTQTYTVIVTAEGGETRTYTVNIQRASAANQAEPYWIEFTSDIDDVIPDIFSARYQYDSYVPYKMQNGDLKVYPMDAGTTYEIYRNGKLVATNETASIDFNVGTNKVEAVLTSSTGVHKTYTFYVHRDNLDSLVDLDELGMSSVLSSSYSEDYSKERINGFKKDTMSYNISLPNSASSVKFSAYPFDDDATMVVKKGSTTIPYVEGSGYTVSLTAGLNTVTFTVSHPLVGYSKTYTVNVTRAASAASNADLCNLYVGYDQMEGFSASDTSYDFTYPYAVTIRPVVSNSGATYKIYKDGSLISTNAPADCSTSSSAVITVRVTATNTTTTKTYTINLSSVGSSAELDGILLSDTNNDTGYHQSIDIQDTEVTYSASSPYYDDELDLYADCPHQAGQLIKLYKEQTLLASDIENLSTNLSLEIGLNTYRILVTAENGVTQKEYTLNITRGAEPSDDNANILGVNMWFDEEYDGFQYGVTNYNLNVESNENNAEFGVYLEDFRAKCSVYLNGRLIITRNHFSLNCLYLNEGPNTLSAVVTAANGVTTKTYTFLIERAASALKGIEIITEPENLEARKGQAPNLTGLSVMANHTSGYFEMLDQDDVTVTGYNSSQLGSQTLTVNYGGYSDTFSINVIQPVASVEINKSTVSLVHGDTTTLTATVLPNDAKYPAVTWQSNNTAVATVDQTGKVTAVSVGSATITATADGVSDTCEVEVLKKAVSGVTISSDAETLVVGNSKSLSATVLPADATYPTVTWSSDDEAVATVDQTGKVMAVGIGNATITATADGVSDACEVQVIKKAVTGVTISSETETIVIGNSKTLSATVLPADATYPTVTWSSDDEDIVTVDQTGKVTAVGVGSATITATADGISDTCEITVQKIAVSGVTISSETEAIVVGNTKTLTTTVLPADATYQEVAWSSDDEDVATVDGTGKVTAVAPGKATITATADGVSDTCEITVVPAEYRITAAANNAAYGTVTGGGVYSNGASVTLYATPKAGYRFVRWTDGSTQLSTNAKYTLTANADRSITAEFAAIGVPTLTAASSGYNSIKLTWTAVTGAAGYEVWRSSTANGTYIKLGTATGTTYANTGLTLNTPYYYKVNAYCTATTATTYGNRSAYAVATPVPAAPTISASATSYNSVKVSWSAVPGASGYELSRATSQNGSYSVVKSVTATSYTNTSLNTGTTYYYKVRAYAGNKVYGTYSAVISIKPMLSAVTGVSASAYNPTSVKITWGSVSGKSGYEVWRSTSPSGGFVKIKSVSSTSYKDTTLTPFVTYYYQIRVYRTVSSKPVYSASASATVSARPVLGNVTGVKAVVGSPSSVKLSWSSVSGCSGYEIRRSTAVKGTYTAIKTVTGKSYTDSNLTPNTTYYYQVVAYRTVGGKVYSTPCAPVSARPVFAPVTNLKAVRSSTGKIKLTWSAVSGRKGYIISRSTNPTSGFVTIKSLTSTSFTDSGLTPGVTYYYKVQAYLKVGSSNYSSAPSAVVSVIP